MTDEEIGMESEADTAEVEESGAAGPAAASTEATPPAASPMEPADLEPPRKQTGLIVVVASMVLLLILAVFAGPPMYDAVNKWLSGKSPVTTETLSPAKAKITATIGFVQAYMDTDVLKLRPFLTDEAQAAATDAQWTATAATLATGAITFNAPVWSGDTTAVVTFSAPDALTGSETTGTLTFGTTDAQPPTVTMVFDSAGSADEVTFTLLSSGSTWRVVSETSAGGSGNYDAEFVGSIIPTDTVQ